MHQRQRLNDKQLRRLKQMGFTKKELKSLATIKCKNFYLGDITNPESITRLNENGSTHDKE
jgi:hypothetical protein